MIIIVSGLGLLSIALSSGIAAINRVGIGSASVGGILVAGALTLLLPFIPLALSARASCPNAFLPIPLHAPCPIPLHKSPAPARSVGAPPPKLTSGRVAPFFSAPAKVIATPPPMG